MPVTNNNKKIVDLPFMELLTQAPAATSAITSTTSTRVGQADFIYSLLSATNFFRYDTVTDTWQQLATPVTTPTALSSIRYASRRGYHGRVLSATSTTITIPGLRGPALSGSVIAIDRGPGAGQERTLATFVGESILDAGVITGTTTATLADSTKRWNFNQWAGHTVLINFGTGAPIYKKILYNDTTTLYISDDNLRPHEPWNNQPFVAVAPYALPVTTAGSQAHYQILASTFTIDTPWEVTPDSTSYFLTLTGGLYLYSSLAAAPFFSLQYYDVANDAWQTKTVPQSLVLASLGTDSAFETTSKIGNAFLQRSGSTISATARSLSDSGINIPVDRYANHRLYITSGSGRGQDRRIVGNNSGSFFVTPAFTTTPDATSRYEVWSDARAYSIIGNTSAILGYHPDEDVWSQGHLFDSGIVANMAVTMAGWVPIGLASSTVPIAAGITAINSVPTAGGTGYVIGDILTCSVGGTGAQVIVTGISAGGVVTSLALVNSGTATGFTVGTGRATTGGTGTGCTIEITSVGRTSNLTTSTATWFKTGDSVTVSGCSEAAWNTTYTILGVSALSTTACTFSVATTALSAVSATSSQSTTTIVDPSKNWVVNEHVGRLVHLMVAGVSPTSQIRWITANTATTLTVATITAGVAGTSKYAIYDAKPYGSDALSRVTRRENVGWASGSGQSTTTLVDVTKQWIPNQWSGSMFKIETGTGYGSGRITITSNTTSSLIYATQTFTPDATTKYEIADTWGLLTGTPSTTVIPANNIINWPTNFFAGKRVRIFAGTGVGQETSVTSNTNNTLTVTAVTTAPVVADSVYGIVGQPIRTAATNIIWLYGTTNDRGRFIISPRGGGSNNIDFYDIVTNRWIMAHWYAPLSETYTTGTSYAYDGGDHVYFAKGVTVGTPIRIFDYDLTTHTLRGLMSTTILQGTATVGNMADVITTEDGLDYIYVLQNTGTQFTRGLINW